MNPKYVSMNYKHITFRFSPLTRSSGSVVFAINMEPLVNIPFVGRLVESVTVKFAMEFFKNIVTLSEKYSGSEWEKRTK